MAKKKSLSKLKEELDVIYSRYIRLSNADDKGYCTCISCKSKHHWTKIQNGHYCSRRHEVTRWYDKNNHPQCVACNIYAEGSKIWYRRNIVDNYYGEKEVRHIEDISLEKAPINRKETLELIDEYSRSVHKLEEQFILKGIYHDEIDSDTILSIINDLSNGLSQKKTKEKYNVPISLVSNLVKHKDLVK